VKDWLTPLDVATLTGFSVSFIRAEIKAGELPAILVTSQSRARQRGRWRIARVEAIAYAIRLGVGPRTEHTQRTDDTTTP
jgi:hypothetical protein